MRPAPSCIHNFLPHVLPMLSYFRSASRWLRGRLSGSCAAAELHTPACIQAARCCMVTGSPALPFAPSLQSCPRIGSGSRKTLLPLAAAESQRVAIGPSPRLPLLGDSACVNILVVSFNGVCLPAARFCRCVQTEAERL